MKRNLFLFLLVGLVFSLSGILSAPATAQLIIPLDFEYSGAPPAGSPPWLTASFLANTDETSGDPTGSVRLTMAATNLADGEFVTNWFFNLNPFYNIALESGLLDAVAVDETDSVAGWGFGTGINEFKAGPDGYYDLHFGFDTSNGDKGNRFIAGEVLVFDLMLTGEFLTPEDFDFLSDPGEKPEDKGPFLSAAHVQGIKSNIDDSGWIAPGAETVPEASTLLLVGVGLIGLAGFGRRRFKA